MSPFPILKLPYVAQCVLVPLMDSISLIEFSLASKKVRNLLQLVKLRADTVTFTIPQALCMEVESAGRTLILEPIFKMNGNRKLEFDGDMVPVRELFRSASNSVYGCKCKEGSEIQLLEKITTHFLTFLRNTKFNLVINGDILVSDYGFFWRTIKKFGRITVAGRWENTVIMLPKTLKFLQEELEKDELFLQVNLWKY